MNVQRFEGRDMSEVLAQIRRTLGPDAVIVSTQAKQHGRLRRRKTVEVIAGLPEPDTVLAAPNPAPARAATASGAIPSLAERLLQEEAVAPVSAHSAPAHSPPPAPQ